MHIERIGWLGSRVDDAATFDAMVAFYRDTLGLRVAEVEEGFVAFALPNGDHVEVFGPRQTEHTHFTTGPVAGFRVDDLEAAVAELRAAGIELVGTPGPAWQHFVAPDGRVYELVRRGR